MGLEQWVEQVRHLWAGLVPKSKVKKRHAIAFSLGWVGVGCARTLLAWVGVSPTPSALGWWWGGWTQLLLAWDGVSWGQVPSCSNLIGLGPFY